MHAQLMGAAGQRLQLEPGQRPGLVVARPSTR